VFTPEWSDVIGMVVDRPIGIVLDIPMHYLVCYKLRV